MIRVHEANSPNLIAAVQDFDMPALYRFARSYLKECALPHSGYEEQLALPGDPTEIAEMDELGLSSSEPFDTEEPGVYWQAFWFEGDDEVFLCKVA